MPITESAEKALRQSHRRRVFNRRRQRAMREAITVSRSVVPADRPRLLAAAYQAIDKAVKRGVIAKNTAARKKSRLAHLLQSSIAV